MKTKILSLTIAACGLFFTTNSNAQLQDEKNVTITMDLQPILQLNMQGPDQIDFTFDQIWQYYAGIAKYGATTLKVSSSVSFDLWAAGLSQAQIGNFLWDNPVNYGGAAGANSATGANNFLPCAALELRQFPANPSRSAPICANASGANASADYSTTFQVASAAGVAAANNSIYSPNPTAPYTSPTSTAAVGTSEKYIAGGTGTGVNCQVAGGSYLTQAALGTSSYYYIIDYRIVPGLPATFPFFNGTATDRAFAGTGAVLNNTAGYIISANGATVLGNTATTNFTQPGVYTMYVKYILAEDQ